MVKQKKASDPFLDLNFEFLKIYDAYKDSFFQFKKKTFLITGSSGMIGNYLVRFLSFLNESFDFQITIVANGRSKEHLNKSFYNLQKNNLFFYISDIKQRIELKKPVDYVIHLASNASPFLYATKPIDTETSIFTGTNNLLEYSVQNKITKFFFASSTDIYGNQPVNPSGYNENDFGEVNSLDIRSSYSEGKRASETLCKAYFYEKNVPIIIGRLSRTFGPTMVLNNDNLATKDFFYKACSKENIVLKNPNAKEFSFTYVGDIVSGILFLIANGKNGEAYNISNSSCNLTIASFAKTIAHQCKVNCVYTKDLSKTGLGYSNLKNSILSTKKIELLGWKWLFDLNYSIKETTSIVSKRLKNMKI